MYSAVILKHSARCHPDTTLLHVSLIWTHGNDQPNVKLRDIFLLVIASDEKVVGSVCCIITSCEPLDTEYNKHIAQIYQKGHKSQRNGTMNIKNDIHSKPSQRNATCHWELMQNYNKSMQHRHKITTSNQKKKQ